MDRAPAHPRPFVEVMEIADSTCGALVHTGWSKAFPWLLQGTTTRDSCDDHPFDLGLFAEHSQPVSARRRWAALRKALGSDQVVHARQVHGAEVRAHRGEVAGVDEPRLVEDCDGHAADTPGVLLAVTTADCVPVFLIDADRRVVAALHAGWRGASAGVLERGIETLASTFSCLPEHLRVHLGPAICGGCYEVGPEVFEALGQEVPDRPRPIDLRRVLGQRAVLAGVPHQAISVSVHCTRCTGSRLFSHRMGDTGRQAGFIGIRA